VQAHSHPERRRTKRRLRSESGGARRLGRAKRHEERVTGRIDLDALVVLPDVSEKAVVLSDDVRVPIAQIVEQTRRSLDVCEQKRDRAFRQVPHPPRMTPSRSFV
jgi:hypothetical protein